MNTLSDLVVIPSGAALGAELRGLDFARPLHQTVRDRVKALWHEHLVLVIRGQILSPEQYLETATIFGKPQVGANRAYYRKEGKSVPHDLGIPEISVLTNLDRAGNPAKVNEGLGSLEVVWHTDNSYIEHPPAGSALYAREIPDDGTGETSFSNQYLALEQLPPHLRDAVSGKRSKQDASRNSAGVLRPGVKKPESTADVPGPMHPLIRIHPATGRSALYLGRRRVWPSQYIEGLADADSEQLLDELWAHATQDHLKWTHRWAVGDFLAWDNRCTMHRREEVNPSQRRVMWRTQFQGEPVVAA